MAKRLTREDKCRQKALEILQIAEDCGWDAVFALSEEDNGYYANFTFAHTFDDEQLMVDELFLYEDDEVAFVDWVEEFIDRLNDRPEDYEENYGVIGTEMVKRMMIEFYNTLIDHFDLCLKKSRHS